MEARLVRKHFVNFYFPGLSFDDAEERDPTEVAERDPARVEVPPEAFGFSFCDQIVGVAVDCDKEIPISSGVLNRSPKYYYGGRVYTAAEIKEELSYKRNLIRDMEISGYQRMIKCRTGNWEPFRDDNVFIEEKTAV